MSPCIPLPERLTAECCIPGLLRALLLLHLLLPGAILPAVGAEQGHGTRGTAENAVSQSAGEVPREDVTAAIKSWVDERTGTNEIFRFVNVQLDSLWKKRPELRTARKDSADRIRLLWSAAGEPSSSRDASGLTPDSALVLVWQTYHVLQADHHPLDAQSQARKEAQFARLCGILDGLDERAAAGTTNLPPGTIEAIKSKAGECGLLLKQYMSSPANPFLFYPLPDDRFENAVTKIESQIPGFIADFFRRCASERKRLIEQEELRPRSLFSYGRKTAADKRLQTSCAVEGGLLAARSMGRIEIEYGFIARGVKNDDPMMFPLWKVRGFGTGSSASVTLNIDWSSLAQGEESGTKQNPEGVNER